MDSLTSILVPIQALDKHQTMQDLPILVLLLGATP